MGKGGVGYGACGNSICTLTAGCDTRSMRSHRDFSPTTLPANMGHMNLSKTNDRPARFTLGIPNANPKGSLGLRFRDELVRHRVEWKGEI